MSRSSNIHLAMWQDYDISWTADLKCDPHPTTQSNLWEQLIWCSPNIKHLKPNWLLGLHHENARWWLLHVYNVTKSLIHRRRYVWTTRSVVFFNCITSVACPSSWLTPLLHPCPRPSPSLCAISPVATALSQHVSTRGSMLLYISVDPPPFCSLKSLWYSAHWKDSREVVSDIYSRKWRTLVPSVVAFLLLLAYWLSLAMRSMHVTLLFLLCLRVLFPSASLWQ